MKRFSLSAALFCAASLCLASPGLAPAAGHQGCCSSHGGVSQRCVNGYVVCNDGTTSASCLCEGGSVKSRRSKGEGMGSAGAGYEPRRSPAPQREAARSAKRDKPFDPGQRQTGQANRPAPRQAPQSGAEQMRSEPRPAPNQVNRPAPNQVNRPAPSQVAPRPASVDKYGRPVNAGRQPASGKKVDKYGHAVPKY